MKATFAALILIYGLGIASQVLANCTYGGQSYPTGTRAGNLTCQSDGTWR